MVCRCFFARAGAGAFVQNRMRREQRAFGRRALGCETRRHGLAAEPACPAARLPAQADGEGAAASDQAAFRFLRSIAHTVTAIQNTAIGYHRLPGRNPPGSRAAYPHEAGKSFPTA